MTSDIDQLASAYIDGETTAAEAAWVESSPEAMRYVDEYRKIQSLVKHVDPVESSTKERNIGAALAAFSDEFDKTVEVPLKLSPEPPKTLSTPIAGDISGDDNVVPVHGRGTPRTTGIATSPTVTTMSKRRNRWLAPVASAAAVVALAATGMSLFASQDGFTTSDGEATSEVAADQATASEQTITATQGKTEAGSEESEDAEAAPTDDAAQLSDSDGDSSDETATSQTSSPESGPLVLDSVPPDEELELLATESTLSTDFTTSSCARSVTDPDGGDRVGFLPVSIDGVNGEIIVFESATNANGVSVSLVTAECVPFSGRS